MMRVGRAFRAGAAVLPEKSVEAIEKADRAGAGAVARRPG